MAKATSKPTKPKASRSTTKAASTTPRAAKAVVKPAAVATDNELTKKELIDRVVTESGMKRGEVRTALEATLMVLGQALREGSDISAAPLGKIKVKRQKDTPNGKLVVLRVKLKDVVTGPAD